MWCKFRVSDVCGQYLKAKLWDHLQSKVTDSTTNSIIEQQPTIVASAIAAIKHVGQQDREPTKEDYGNPRTDGC